MLTILKDNRTFNVHFLEHMLHHKNLENILTYGLLSHNEAYKRGLISEDISMSEVQRRRKAKTIKTGKFNLGIHDMVSFYFNSKNPMLYVRKNLQDELVIILIESNILDSKDTDEQFAIFSDGNAGSTSTKFFIGKHNLNNVDFELIFGGSWNSDTEDVKRENKRKMCSEVLVYPLIYVKDIKKIICPNQKMFDYVEKLKGKFNTIASHIIVEVNRNYYF